MQYAPEERWRMLCGIAADEQDPQKLLVLIQEINNLLEEQKSRSTIPNSDGLRMSDFEIMPSRRLSSRRDTTGKGLRGCSNAGRARG